MIRELGESIQPPDHSLTPSVALLTSAYVQTTASPPLSTLTMSSSDAAASASSPREAFYSDLLAAARAQFAAAPSADPTALCANISALVYRSFAASFKSAPSSPVNWAGFYLLRRIEPDPANIAAAAASHGVDAAAVAAVDAPAPLPPTEVLLLGPFHGEPAVSLIRVGKGVCGSAVSQRATQLVPDVHARPDHIACDSASKSELVVPIYGGAPSAAAAAPGAHRPIVGVLDLDSSVLNFWGPEDVAPMEQLAELLGAAADWSILERPIRVRIPGQTATQRFALLLLLLGCIARAWM